MSCDKAKLKEAFDAMDADGSGMIDSKELCGLLEKSGCSEEKCKEYSEVRYGIIIRLILLVLLRAI